MKEKPLTPEERVDLMKQIVDDYETRVGVYLAGMLQITSALSNTREHERLNALTEALSSKDE